MNTMEEIAIIGKKNRISNNEIVYTVDHIELGNWDKIGGYFKTKDDIVYFKADDYESYLGITQKEEYLCISHKALEEYKKEIKEENNTEEKDEYFCKKLYNECCDTIYLTYIDINKKRVDIKEIISTENKEKNKEYTTSKGKQIVKEHFASINNFKDENNKDLISLIKNNLPNIKDYNEYDSFIELKETVEKIYHEKIVFIACLLQLTKDNHLIENFKEEFKDNKYIIALARTLQEQDFTNEEINNCLKCTRNSIDKLNDYLNEISEKIKYKERTKKIKEEKQKDYNFIFTTLLDIKNSNQIIDSLKKTIISQDDAIERIVTEINQSKLLSNPKDKTGILLTGSTGVGKTLLVSKIAELLDKDVCIIDSSQLVINGYKGTHISEALKTCLQQVDNDTKRLENAIIFFDEIDKKGMNSDSDIAGKGVLDSLLKFLDGTSYTIELETNKGSKEIEIKTDNMLVIGGGSFSNVYEKRSKNPLGFTGTFEESTKEPTSEDFVKKGNMTKEFMGRFSTIIHLNDLKIEDYERILTESDISPLKAQYEIFEKLGIELIITPEYINQVAKVTDDLKVGARGLKSVVKNSTWMAFKDVSTHFGDVKKIKLTSNTVENNKNYTVYKIDGTKYNPIQEEKINQKII